jgi:hypothetical protein
MFLPLRHASPQEYYFQFCLTVLLTQNFCFLLTVFVNQGMLSRDPTVHRKEYLIEIANKNKEFSICKRCKLIRPESGKMICHCVDCDVCVVNHDHHCVWCSKCIGGGNIYFFYGFLAMTLFSLVLFWINVLAALARVDK